VGKLDATADRKADLLQADAIHQDVTFTKAMTAAVDNEIATWARTGSRRASPPVS
jgi:hypothetical protein